MMRSAILPAVIVFMLAAAPALGQADTPVAADQNPQASPELTEQQQQGQLKGLIMLLLITLVLLVVMIAALVIFGITIRKRLRIFEEQRPKLPTELEDLWWRMNNPEPGDSGDEEKKDDS